MYSVHVYIVHDYPTKQSTSVYHNIEWMLNEIKKCINKLGRTVLDTQHLCLPLMRPSVQQ
jgi:hypothetical protein